MARNPVKVMLTVITNGSFSNPCSGVITTKFIPLPLCSGRRKIAEYNSADFIFLNIYISPNRNAIADSRSALLLGMYNIAQRYKSDQKNSFFPIVHADIAVPISLLNVYNRFIK